MANYSQEEIRDAKLRFLDDLWEYRSFEATYKTQKYITGRLHCKKENLRIWMHRLRKRKHGDINLHVFYEIVAFATNEIVMNLDDFRVEQCLLTSTEEDDKRAILFKYLFTSIPFRVQELINQIKNVKSEGTTKTEKGKITRLFRYVRMPSLSTDVKNDNEDNDGTELIEEITNDNSLFSKKSNYYPTKFLQWFRENRDTILTEYQNEALQIMIENQHERMGAGYTEPVIWEKLGYTQKKIHDTEYRIKKRVNQMWEKLNIDESFNSSKKKHDIELLNDFLELLDSDMDDQLHRDKITKWITTKMRKSRMLSDLIYDNVRDKETTYKIVEGFKGVPFDNRTILTIENIIRQKLHSLENWNVEDTVPYGKRQFKVIKNNDFVVPEGKTSVTIVLNLQPTGIYAENIY